jgi:hypothetical protein
LKNVPAGAMNARRPSRRHVAAASPTVERTIMSANAKVPAGGEPDNPKVRNFAVIGYESDTPVDHLHVAESLLYAAKLAVSAVERGETMSVGEALGVIEVLDAARALVKLAGEQAGRLIGDPYTAGYRRGLAVASAEYRRGFGEGRAAALAEKGRES